MGRARQSRTKPQLTIASPETQTEAETETDRSSESSMTIEAPNANLCHPGFRARPEPKTSLVNKAIGGLAMPSSRRKPIKAVCARSREGRSACRGSPSRPRPWSLAGLGRLRGPPILGP